MNTPVDVVHIAAVGGSEWAALVASVGTSAGAVVEHVRVVAPETWDKYALVLLDYEDLDPADQARVGVSSFSTPVVVRGGALCRAALPELFEHTDLRHLVGHGGVLEREELIVTLAKLCGGDDIFGVERYLSADCARASFALRRASEKQSALGRITKFASLAGVQRRVGDLFWVAAEELITNAIYNAPVDSSGLHRSAHQPRDAEVVLAEHEVIRVDLGYDGQRLAVAVTDPFGSVEPLHLLRMLAKCLRRGEDQVDDKPGGAGLGIFRLFESASQLVFNVAPGQRTEAIAILEAGTSFREMSARYKSFHVFSTRSFSPVHTVVPGAAAG